MPFTAIRFLTLFSVPQISEIWFLVSHNITRRKSAPLTTTQGSRSVPALPHARHQSPSLIITTSHSSLLALLITTSLFSFVFFMTTSRVHQLSVFFTLHLLFLFFHFVNKFSLTTLRCHNTHRHGIGMSALLLARTLTHTLTLKIKVHLTLGRFT